MKKRIEFPLVELLLIIILLFSLAVFALPKFMDVGTEARIKALNATALNLNSMNRMLYSRASIKGVQHQPLQSTDILGEKDAGAFLVYGEVRAQESDLRRFMDSEFLDFGTVSEPGKIRLYLDNYKNNACYINYQQAYETMVNDKKVIKKAVAKVKSTGC